MNRLHIAIFQPPMHGNGLDRVVLNLAKAFVEFGFCVDLVTPEISKYQKQATQGYPSQIRNIRLLDVSITKPIFLEKVIKLSQYLKEVRPDILLANNDYVGVANLAKSISNSPTKLVHGVHINVSQYFSKLSGIRATIRPFLLKHSYCKADGIIAVSQGVAKDLAQLINIPTEKIQVIYNPVVTPDLLLKANESLEHLWFAPSEPPVILGAGRLFHQKDFVTLIKAFAKVRQKQNCRLIIIGEWSPYKFELDTLINELNLGDDVDFPGYVHNPYAYMAHASLFVMSSKYEGFGNVLVEAMAVGTPVVSTDCESGPAEILDQGRYGKLVPVGDSDALASAILKTIEHSIDAKILQERAQKFSQEKIARQYLDYFEILSK
ncbi:glycosyltransferase [Thermocoleostomius sinensis]|uniref:Glycosyltransferase n=1 Tax=Thermocoleostomius sinensis A174 TaxID=2016057 RepID=A0A9E8Z8R4_9CYAN|nr:glycosyltransferase [Thermocoleostomius sinensis]WAL58387.1 glycosyltransferase [Thermocoleostomius sinensis A174]